MQFLKIFPEHITIVKLIYSRCSQAEDDELTILLLQRHLAADVVSTPYYAILVEYVLANQSGDSDTPYYLQVPVLANQLEEAGLELEAASLVLRYRGTHPVLRTFDAALGMLGRMFHR